MQTSLTLTHVNKPLQTVVDPFFWGGEALQSLTVTPHVQGVVSGDILLKV